VIQIIITNNHNIPQTLVNVIKRGIYKPTANMRVTELINAPLVKELTIKHWDEITVDVTEYLFSILGQSVHYILHEGKPDDSLGEERISGTFINGTIAGKSDLYHKEGIEDWKVTSVFSFLLGVKEEWEAQLNVYKRIWELNHFPVKTLKINAILRDWMRGKAKYDMSYPQIPFLSYIVKPWDVEMADFYINQRFAIHKVESIECTPHEKWERPTTYAVMKGGNKRATRVLDTEKEAELYIKDIKDDKVREQMSIELRKGECVKCADYCTPRDFCPYNKRKEENLCL